MTYNEIFDSAKEMLFSGSTDGFNGNFAIQINIIGEGAGAFYVAYKNNKLSVEPYQYNDRDASMTATAENFIKILEGKLNPVVAFTTGKLKIDGNISKTLEYQKMLETIFANKKKADNKRK